MRNNLVTAMIMIMGIATGLYFKKFKRNIYAFAAKFVCLESNFFTQQKDEENVNRS